MCDQRFCDLLMPWYISGTPTDVIAFGLGECFPYHLHTCWIVFSLYVCVVIFTIGKLSDKIFLIVAWCMFCFVIMFALVGTECVSFILFTTLENEVGNLGEEAYFNICYFQEQDQDQYQGKPCKCLLILYLSLSIMPVFYFWSFTKIV